MTTQLRATGSRHGLEERGRPAAFLAALRPAIETAQVTEATV